MAYQKIGFKNGNVLTAEQLIHMEDGIIDAGKKAQSGGGASLPDAAPYQQLVTDGEGKWGTADRLAWSDVVVDFEWDGDKNNPIFDPEMQMFLISEHVTSPEQIDGATYVVNDGTEDNLESEPAILNASDFVKNEDAPLYGAELEVKIPAASSRVMTYLDIVSEDFESGGKTVKAGLYGGMGLDQSYVAKLKKGTIHPIPAKYITGAPLTGDDWGKVLAVGEDEYGLALVFSPKVIRFDIFSHGCFCNLGYNEFMAATENGTPIVFNDLTDSGGTIIRSVFRIQIADYGETTYLTVYDEKTRNELYRYKFTVDGIVSETTSPT